MLSTNNRSSVGTIPIESHLMITQLEQRDDDEHGDQQRHAQASQG